MEKNNGKIAIAIVAMFVVALSVVGFTYAYFVASVQGNTNENVTVTAGILEVSYKNTKTISAVSLVPGWQSDNLHYFDADAYTVENNPTTGAPENHYTACVKGSSTDHANCTDESASTTNGLAEPASFSVTNTDRNTAATSYVILLNGITNTLSTTEQANFKYALCEGTCPEGEFSTLTDSNTISRGVVGKTGDVQVISPVQTLTDTEDVKGTKSYQLKLYYLETSEKQEGMGASVSATIDIVGVSQATDGAWYDANGVKIIEAAA